VQTKDPKNSAPGRRFDGLELLRFAAAFAVLVWHYQHFFHNPPTGDATLFDRARQPFFRVLFRFYERGHLAVQVFWAISGFIFFYKYADAIYARSISLYRFIVLRFTRLYPLHFVTLLAVAMLQSLFAAHHGGQSYVYAENDRFHFLLNLLMVPHWGYQHGWSFNAPMWSVSVEEFSYLAFFMVASGVAMRGRGTLGIAAAALVFLTASVFTSEFGECFSLFLWGGVLYGVHERVSRVAAAAALAIAISLALWTPPFDGLLLMRAGVLVFVTALIVAFVRLTPQHPWCAKLGALT
jgi:peptidoglycan/LPS O-acetylase OafA/YrhL